MAVAAPPTYEEVTRGQVIHCTYDGTRPGFIEAVRVAHSSCNGTVAARYVHDDLGAVYGSYEELALNFVKPAPSSALSCTS